MEHYVIHSTVEIAGQLVAQGTLGDHIWDTLQACQDYMVGSDTFWLNAKAWLEHMAGPEATINYECIPSDGKSI